MSWFIRLKLSTLPVLDSNNIDAVILSRDIDTQLGLPRDIAYNDSEKVRYKKAVKRFYSVASAEGYANKHTFKGMPLNFGRIDAWKRLGPCLVHLSCGPTHPPGFPPVPLECIVRTGNSAWELYSFTTLELCENSVENCK